MIKEELRKEIEKEAKRRTQGFRNQENCIQSYIMGATDFAEPREKEITELNSKLSEQMFECTHCEDRFNANHKQYLLSQAKAVIEKLLNAFASNDFFEEEELSAMGEAEQFLKNLEAE